MNGVLRDAIDLLKEPNAKRRAVDSVINKKFTQLSGIRNAQMAPVLSRIGKNQGDLTRYERLAVKKLIKESNIGDITKEEVDKMSKRLREDVDLQAKFKVGVDWFKDPAKKLLSSSSTQGERDLAAKQLGMRIGVAAVGTLAAAKVMHDLDSKDTLLGKLPYSSKDAMNFAIDRIAKL